MGDNIGGPGVVMTGGGSAPPRTPEALAQQVSEAVEEANRRGIDLSYLLHQHGIAFTNPDEPIVNVRRRGVRLIGTAYDIGRVLEACKRAMESIEQNSITLTEARTIVVHAPQDDEP